MDPPKPDEQELPSDCSAPVRFWFWVLVALAVFDIFSGFIAGGVLVAVVLFVIWRHNGTPTALFNGR